ncbi:LAMI_0H18954g1_1 [Lachancea mirantina]|uniref:Chromatin modification-related protein EAF3 n=1 Tax=Lachancea mirantina TaxID=1230905 RepID=A0A1G4KJP9_9SACH|nr:LAMI_0H18954g1_1 [Lachancea mirantina]
MSLKENSKCLAFHGPLLYEARILKVHHSGEDPGDDEEIPEDLTEQECFYIHYQGWKSSWDEWIGKERIREYDEQNLALKKQLIEEAREARSAAKKTGSGVKSKKTDSKRKKPSGPAAAAGSQLYASPGKVEATGPRIVVHIPQQLKAILVDDWEAITKDKKLVELPCSSNVDKLLTYFYEHTSSNEPSPVAQSQLCEYCDGLRLYFDRALPVMLLYRFERLQLAENLDEPPHSIYGAMHLLRLLSMLPQVVACTTMDDQSCEVIVGYTDKLLLWLLQQQDKLFSKSLYVNTGSQYEGLALGM